MTLIDGSYWVYDYDSLGQVESGKRYWSDGTPVAGQQFDPSPSKPSDRQAALDGETKINVFFGTTKALSIGEIRTNAVTALKRKGYNVPADATCVISVAVLGPKAGCTVMFWDFKTKWTYQVGFDGQGNVSETWGGAIRHGTVGPKDPLPTVPEGGIRMKP